jgi:hypothetical protein
VDKYDHDIAHYLPGGTGENQDNVNENRINLSNQSIESRLQYLCVLSTESIE